MAQDDREQKLCANSLRVIRRSSASTGLRPHPFRYDALTLSAQGTTAEEFLVASRLRRGDAEMGCSVRDYLVGASQDVLPLLGREGRRGYPCVELPPSVGLTMSLGEAMRRRRSVRQYNGDALPLASLATMARSACAVLGPTHRTAPSGGGLYPVKLHIAALRVEGLSAGIYFYDPFRDELAHTGGEETAAGVLAALAVAGRIISEDKACAVFLLIGRPWRSMRKYGDRGMRYVFLEAGAMAEHISLAAAALGVGDVHCGSFYDDEVHEALNIDGVHAALVHAVFVGTPG